MKEKIAEQKGKTAQADHSYTTGFLIPKFLCVMCFFESHKEHEEKIAEQREKQHQLIGTGALISSLVCNVFL